MGSNPVFGEGACTAHAEYLQRPVKRNCTAISFFVGGTPWNRTKQTLVKSQIPKPIGLRPFILREA